MAWGNTSKMDKARQCVIASGLFTAMVSGLIFFVLPLAEKMDVNDDGRRQLFVLLGPVSSLDTHLWIFGLVIGASAVLTFIIQAIVFSNWRLLNVTCAIVLWIFEGIFLSGWI